MALIDFLERKRDLALLVFTKSELKIIEKQSQGFFLAQSERNVLSRSIRKKFEFIKEVFMYEADFRLVKGFSVKNIISNALDVLKKDPRVDSVFLFGSVLTNNFSPISDIDIAVKFRKISRRDATIFLKVNYSLVSERVDLGVFNIMPEKIQSEILKNGRKIYSNSGEGF